MRHSTIRAAILFAAAGTLLGILPASAADKGIEVRMNQAKIVRLARPANTVIVGEPGIADVAVKDSNTLVITGKGFGVTNLVVLDSDDNPVVDEMIYVRRSHVASVRIYRRSEVQTLSCVPYCEAEFKNDAAQASDASTSSN